MARKIKKAAITKIDDQYRVFAYLDSYKDDAGLRGLNIRVANRKDRNKNINLPVYLPNGERLKLVTEQLNSGVVTGMKETTLNLVTARIDWMIEELRQITSNGVFTKQSLEEHLYGTNFLAQHKKKRTKDYHFQLKEEVATDYYQELRKVYPETIKMLPFEVFNDDGIVIGTLEIPSAVDPMELSDFPNNLHPDLYKKLKDEFLASVPKDRSEKYLRDAQRLKVQILMYAKTHFFKSETKEILEVGREEMLELKRIDPRRFRFASFGSSIIDDTGEILKKIKNSKLPTKERFQKGYYDQSNIFELFASIKYREDYSSTYNKIIIRLFQYRYFKKPMEHISNLSKEWFTDFFRYLWETGYYMVNTVKFDPLSPHYGQIFEGKNLEPNYDSNQLHSLRDITRTVLNKFLEHGLIETKIELPSITEITGKPYNEGKGVK